MLDIELKEDLNIDKLENFNIGIQTYLSLEREHEEFTIIKVNLNIIKNDDKEHSYDKDNFYFESNNVKHHCQGFQVNLGTEKRQWKCLNKFY